MENLLLLTAKEIDVMTNPQTANADVLEKARAYDAMLGNCIEAVRKGAPYGALQGALIGHVTVLAAECVELLDALRERAGGREEGMRAMLREMYRNAPREIRDLLENLLFKMRCKQPVDEAIGIVREYALSFLRFIISARAELAAPAAA